MNRDKYFMSLALKEAKKAYDKGAISRSEMETSVKRILGLILKLD